MDALIVLQNSWQYFVVFPLNISGRLNLYLMTVILGVPLLQILLLYDLRKR